MRTTFRRPLPAGGQPRNLERTDQLRAACEAIKRRRIRQDGRLLVFEVVDPPGGGSG